MKSKVILSTFFCVLTGARNFEPHNKVYGRIARYERTPDLTFVVAVKFV